MLKKVLVHLRSIKKLSFTKLECHEKLSELICRPQFVSNGDLF